ncbi:MAG: hypothetical protein Q9M48_00310 [Rhodobacterales bacterium]|nr:hypothetical protein [Rhodobacterales bacterium]
MRNGGRAVGGSGDDLFRLDENLGRSYPDAYEITGGAGHDTFFIDFTPETSFRFAPGSDVHMGAITDYDPAEDQLILEIRDTRAAGNIEVVRIETTPDLARDFVDVHIELRVPNGPDNEFITRTVRIEGITTFDTDDIVFVENAGSQNDVRDSTPISLAASA